MVQFLEQSGLGFEAERVGRGELGEEVCDLAQAAAEGIVLAVVERVGEVVTAADGMFAVRGGAVGLVGNEVDFAQKFGFVVFKFADHGCGYR